MKRIVTLTANTTIDQTLIIPAFEAGRTIRATSSIVSMGGKPTDASYILGQMGIPSLALGFAAGTVGQRVRAMLEGQGAQVDFIEVEGESRINVVIVDERSRAQTTITSASLRVSEAHQAALLAQLEAVLPDAACLVLGGTLPAGVAPELYTTLIERARAASVPVIFDADEPNLSAGLRARPDYIKPNRDELERLSGRRLHDLDAIYRAGRDLQTRYGVSPIVSMGGAGLLALLPHAAWRVPALEVPVISAAGAGDAVLAGLAAALWRGQPIEEGLRLGAALAAAVVQQPGTAQLDPAHVEEALPRIELVRYP